MKLKVYAILVTALLITVFVDHARLNVIVNTVSNPTTEVHRPKDATPLLPGSNDNVVFPEDLTKFVNLKNCSSCLYSVFPYATEGEIHNANGF